MAGFGGGPGLGLVGTFDLNLLPGAAVGSRRAMSQKFLCWQKGGGSARLEQAGTLREDGTGAGPNVLFNSLLSLVPHQFSVPPSIQPGALTHPSSSVPPTTSTAKIFSLNLAYPCPFPV